jgi:flagellar hook-basal body complex protein FliE
MFKNIINKEFTLQVLSHICFGVLGALLVQLVFIPQRTAPAIATVNLTALQDSFIRETAKQSLSQEAMKQKVTSFSQQLTQAINKLASEKHVTILLTEAVISNGKDYTQEVANTVKKGMSQ